VSSTSNPISVGVWIRKTTLPRQPFGYFDGNDRYHKLGTVTIVVNRHWVTIVASLACGNDRLTENP
jgi:hypothetical protein